MDVKTVLNPEVINELLALETETESPILTDLINLYLEQAPARFKAIAEGLKTENYSIIEGESHKLKSSSGSLGSQKLYEIFQQIEDCGRKKSNDGLFALLQKAQPELLQVLKALEYVRANKTPI